MPAVFLPLQICLPLLGASTVCLIVLIRKYVQTIMVIRPVLARLLAEDYAKDSSGKLHPDVIMADFASRIGAVAETAMLGYKFDDDAEYRTLVSRARIFCWLSILAFVVVVVSLGLTLQDF